MRSSGLIKVRHSRVTSCSHPRARAAQAAQAACHAALQLCPSGGGSTTRENGVREGCLCDAAAAVVVLRPLNPTAPLLPHCPPAPHSAPSNRRPFSSSRVFCCCVCSGTPDTATGNGCLEARGTGCGRRPSGEAIRRTCVCSMGQREEGGESGVSRERERVGGGEWRACETGRDRR